MQQAIAEGSVEHVPSSGRAKAVVTFIVIQLLATTALIVGRVAEIGLLKRLRDGANVTLAEATGSDDRILTLAAVYLISLAASGLAWLMWQHRAHRRLRELGIQDLEFTPGWGVGWWFVPVANLFMPYKAVKELWRAGDLPSGTTVESCGPVADPDLVVDRVPGREPRGEGRGRGGFGRVDRRPPHP
jgi:hypothetical protein